MASREYGHPQEHVLQHAHARPSRRRCTPRPHCRRLQAVAPGEPTAMPRTTSDAGALPDQVQLADALWLHDDKEPQPNAPRMYATLQSSATNAIAPDCGSGIDGQAGSVPAWGTESAVRAPSA